MTDSKVYLVFGAYGGIGSALATSLHQAGATLALSGRNEERLGSIATEIDALSLPADASDFAAVEDVVDRTIDRFGRLDGVASCVGSLLLKPAHLTRPEEWQRTLATNLTSTFAILRSSVRPMLKQGIGSIVFVSTAAAQMGLPHHEGIAASKGGVDALVRSAAATYGPAGIRVNAVAPGLVDTPLTKRITSSEKARESSLAMHALKRLGTPRDVASAMAWLLDDDADWITGQVLGVDGGLGQVRAS
jgi:NAD(P)-dependent dehydrogenase (short-subunit alcohol dehydrogenase family)